MKKSLQIARTELSILFFSPIAWLLLVIFTIQGGVAFTDFLASWEASQQLQGTANVSLTQEVFSDSKGFFATMRQYLYLYLPLLTMGLLSREIGSGSIKLLQSSPITVRQIVWGKYMAMLGYCLMLIAILAVYVCIGAIAIEHLDWGFIGSALFGLFLLLAAYAAIGLFFSSLTGYQVVAAISTLAVLGGLSYIGELGKGIEVVRDITYWFAMDRHTGYALRGLLSSRDIIYFLLIIVLFLVLTGMKLNTGRIIRSAAANTVRYVGLVVAVAALGYVTSLPQLSGYWDVTRFDTQSYTPRSLDVIKRVTGPVELTTYANVLGGYANIGAPKFRNLEKTNLEQMERYLPQMKMDYVVYYDTAASIRLDPNVPIEEQALRKAIAWGYDIAGIWSLDSLRKHIDLTPEQGMLVRMLTLDGKSTPLRMFYDIAAYPQESEVIAAIKRLLDGPFRAGMLTGHEERSIHGDGDKDYAAFTTVRSTRSSWINQGAEWVTVVPDSPLLHADSLDLLIIADPYQPYDAQQLERIHQYVRDGGNLLLTGEPNKQHILNPIAERFGVSFNEGVLLQESAELEIDLIQARFASDMANTGFPKTADTVITMPGATALSYRDTAGFKAVPVLETDGRYVWNKLGKVDLKNERPIFQPGADTRVAQAVAVAVIRAVGERQQRILVAGDADFLSKAEFARFNVRAGNGALATELLRWYSDGKYPPDTQRPKSIDNRLRIRKEQVGLIRAAMVFVVPALLAAWGALTIINRRRK
ncbi:ABC-2 type transport system permease protein [Parapedobacter composti]|uniref:ABC-2 type transport system permease protein n=1 Tax=Parapedobacter composti TaxID=623281 RepID=A0A1I1HT55_9SPHI|nr:Gldg family protein [Parapedobacter composti]SFC26985.1 ABC-2 type transport system permease protein [Parapedobacter composti]